MPTAISTREIGLMTSDMATEYLKQLMGMRSNKEELNQCSLSFIYYSTRYEGEWVDGRKEGKGMLYLPSGDTYTAVWKNGISVSGVYTFHPESPWANPDY